MPSIYINHSKNGLYITGKEKDFKHFNVEPTDDTVSSQDIIDASTSVTRFIEAFQTHADTSVLETDTTKKLEDDMKHYFKDFCDSIYGVCGCYNRFRLLGQLMVPVLSKEDSSECFLKLTRRMYNRINYNIVIWCTDRHGKSDPAMTFREDEYMDHILKKMNDSTRAVKIEYIKNHDLKNLVSSIENAYYEMVDFDPWLENLLNKLKNETPGIFFKKMDDGVPFGMWIIAKTIETQSNNIIAGLRKTIGQLLFDNEYIFST